MPMQIHRVVNDSTLFPKLLNCYFIMIKINNNNTFKVPNTFSI